MNLREKFAAYRTHSCSYPLVLLIVAVVTLFTASSANAFGDNECTAQRYGSSVGCTAGDVSITGIAVAPGSPTSCVGGTTFTVDLDITVNFATPDRYDIGIFLANDGKPPEDLPADGGSSNCTVGILPTTSPFYDLDPYGGLDTCGDGNNTIGGGTGSGVVRFYNVPVACQAINYSNGNLYIPFVVSWDNQASPSGATCSSIADPVPGTPSKCNAPKTTTATEVQYGTVNAVVLPDITKTDGVSSVNPGDSLTYTVVITNTTGQPLSGAVFTDPAVNNLTVNSVSCVAGGSATCPTIDPGTGVSDMQGPGFNLPAMPIGSTLTFTIGATVANPVSPAYSHQIVNTAEVTVQGEVNTATDIDSINGAVYADLATSTKSVVDLNGGEADPGDVLRYTITINETAGLAVTGVSVTDNLPLYVNNFTVKSIPFGASDSSTGSGTGNNGTGYLDISNISLAANGSETIIFDVRIAAGTPAGATIDNFATVNNPTGPGATPTAPTITVSPSSVQLTDNKQLYVYGSTPYSLSRNRPSAAPDTNSITVAQGTSVIWNGNNPLPLQLENTVANAYVSLFLTAGNTNTRKVSARMYCSSNPTSYASTSGTYDLNIPSSVTPTQYNFNLTSLNGGFTFPAICTAPNFWVLRVDNSSSGSSRDFYVHPTSGTDFSRLNLDSSNVIYVENLGFYDDSYANGGGTAITTATPGSTVYIRSTISDPFGSFDISSADIEITDPNGNPVLSPTSDSMSEVFDSTTATKIYEYEYNVPPFPVNGNWTVTVTANEGTEGTVTDDQTSAFSVVTPPNLTILKSANGTTNADPGEVVSYTLTVTNSGSGSAINIIVTDAMSPYTALSIDPYGNGTPFTLGGDAGLSIQSIDYANGTDGGGNPTYGYSLVSGAGGLPNGYDGNVTHWQITMTPADSVDSSQQFTIDYQMIVK